MLGVMIDPQTDPSLPPGLFTSGANEAHVHVAL